MHSYNVFYSTLVRNLKRTLIDLEYDFELASKRTRLLLDQLPTSFYSTQDEHSKRSISLRLFELTRTT